ncbi:hypothetical protein, partial [Janibacter hoylei]|uniref:hypothetical protein n=1 Tax=Janibacter hoylei TaxID=364298 RepID=UPI001EDD7DB1
RTWGASPPQRPLGDEGRNRLPEIEVQFDLTGSEVEDVLKRLNENGVTIETTVERQADERRSQRRGYLAMVAAVVGSTTAGVMGTWAERGSLTEPVALLDWAIPVSGLVAFAVTWRAVQLDEPTTNTPSRSAKAARQAWAATVASKRGANDG